jgi:hypothetical protein
MGLTAFPDQTDRKVHWRFSVKPETLQAASAFYEDESVLVLCLWADPFPRQRLNAPLPNCKGVSRMGRVCD